jgi:predicted CXXCH cytochrome family protein
VAHEPVKKARCLECHDPHGSRQARLLKGAYTLDREVQSGGKEYGFCLGCHERARLFEKTGGEGSRFVDGERNLHALHVLVRGRSSEKAAGGKGQTCRTCHEAHSSHTAALTRTELDCGASLCMKMEYRRGDEGGECMASCHSTRMRYRRGPAARPASPPVP